MQEELETKEITMEQNVLEIKQEVQTKEETISDLKTQMELMEARQKEAMEQVSKLLDDEIAEKFNLQVWNVLERLGSPSGTHT